MPATPKRKGSSARRDRRRSQQRLVPGNLTTCPKCKKPKLPHFKCPNCGHYGKLDKKSKTVVAPKKK